MVRLWTQAGGRFPAANSFFLHGQIFFLRLYSQCLQCSDEISVVPLHVFCGLFLDLFTRSTTPLTCVGTMWSSKISQLNFSDRAVRHFSWVTTWNSFLTPSPFLQFFVPEDLWNVNPDDLPTKLLLWQKQIHVVQSGISESPSSKRAQRTITWAVMSEGYKWSGVPKGLALLPHQRSQSAGL